MNRYDYRFRALPPLIRANASQKVGFARGAIFQHRAAGFGPKDDEAIVRQFDLSSMAEFWDVELSESMTCESFAHTLAVHFMVIEDRPGSTAEERKTFGPEAMRAVEIVKVGLRSALRQARIDDEPWFSDIPESHRSSKLDPDALLGFLPSDVIIVSPDPPSDGVYLSKLKVRPRAAAEWLVAMPKRRHLVPPSLIAVLRGDVVEAYTPVVLPSKPRRGRTVGTGYQTADEPIARLANEMTNNGKAKSPSEAVRQLIGSDGKGAIGIGEPASKVERIVKLANSLREAEENRE